MEQRVALYTFGIFKEPSEHPANEGFHRRNDPIFAKVDNAPGFVARSGYEGDPGPASLGRQVYPRFYTERGDGGSPSTLSLWADLESPMAFSYFGLHAEALAHGREWFQKPKWPPYVLWWIPGDHTPDWAEGVTRLEHLHDQGPTAYAFNFKQPFDDDGQTTKIDRHRVKTIASKNA